MNIESTEDTHRKRLSSSQYKLDSRTRKPEEIYDLVEACSPGPYLEIFARFPREGWSQWGNEDVEENSYYGVARRKGHTDPQLRLLASPRGYGVKR